MGTIPGYSGVRIGGHNLSTDLTTGDVASGDGRKVTSRTAAQFLVVLTFAQMNTRRLPSALVATFEEARLMAKKFALAGVGIGAALLLLAPHAVADFDNGGRFKTQVPPMLCEVGTDLFHNGAIGAACQGGFPQAPVEPNSPMHQDQAAVNIDGQFTYRDANIAVGDHPTLNTLTPGQTVTIKGWTVSGTDGVRITSPAGHGMQINADGTVQPF
jgi:hypothetical protein